MTGLPHSLSPADIERLFSAERLSTYLAHCDGDMLSLFEPGMALGPVPAAASRDVTGDVDPTAFSSLPHAVQISPSRATSSSVSGGFILARGRSSRRRVRA
jgi:hypothetical protein